MSEFLILFLGKAGMTFFTLPNLKVEGLQHPEASWHRRVIKTAVNTFTNLCKQGGGAAGVL